MDSLTREDIEFLINHDNEPSLSLIMPFHRTGKGVRQNPIRLKNLVNQTVEMLKEKKYRDRDIDKFIAPLRNLQEDSTFWQNRADGLIIYRSNNFFRYFKLPLNPEEEVILSRRFYLKPLIGMLTIDKPFYILAISQNDVKLLQGSRFTVNEVDLATLPKGLAEALREDDPERQIQFHTKAEVRAGRRAAMFHGQGMGTDLAKHKDEILRYFQIVGKALEDFLAEKRIPLIFAGVDYLFGIYREINNYPYLMEARIQGNVEALRPEEIHKEALEILEPYFRSEIEKAAVKYGNLLGTGHAINDIREIVVSAREGRVDSLFMEPNYHQWGVFHDDTGQVELHDEKKPGDVDLVDYAAVYKFANSGKVFETDSTIMPGVTPTAAILRY